MFRYNVVVLLALKFCYEIFAGLGRSKSPLSPADLGSAQLLNLTTSPSPLSTFHPKQQTTIFSLHHSSIANPNSTTNPHCSLFTFHPNSSQHQLNRSSKPNPNRKFRPKQAWTVRGSIEESSDAPSSLRSSPSSRWMALALSMVSLRLDNQCKVFSPVFVYLVRIFSLPFQEVIIYKNSCNLLFPTGTLVCSYKLMFMRILVFEFFLLEHYKFVALVWQFLTAC